MRSINPDPVEEARRRSALAWHEGGLTEISVGVFLLLQPFLMLAQTLLEPGTHLYRAIAIAQMIFNIGGILLLLRGLPWLRNRLFASRSGFVRRRSTLDPDQKRKAWATGLTALLVASGLIAWNFLNQRGSEVILTLFVGVMGGLLLVQVGLGIGLRRFLILGMLLPVLSAMVAWRAQTLEQAMIWNFVLAGSMLLLSGSIVFVRFWQTNPSTTV